MEQTMRLDKVRNAIKRLPSAPERRIFWIVYNQEMINYTENLIASIKGEEYLKKYVTVVERTDSSKDRSTGIIYFDPGLMYLLGNGNA